MLEWKRHFSNDLQVSVDLVSGYRSEDLCASLQCQQKLSARISTSHSWIFIGRTDAEAETPILWPPDVKNWLTGKDPDAGKDWRQEEKGRTEEEMVGWHHWLNGHELGQALGDSKEQGSLACRSSWGLKEPDMTERLNNNSSDHKKIINFETVAHLYLLRHTKGWGRGEQWDVLSECRQ